MKRISNKMIVERTCHPSELHHGVCSYTQGVEFWIGAEEKEASV